MTQPWWIYRRRSEEEELMDNISCDAEVMIDTLKDLRRVNSLLGGQRSSNLLIRKLPKNEQITIGDVGCGSADILEEMITFGRRNGQLVNGVGLDINPVIIDYAKKVVDHQYVSFEVADIFSDEMKWSKYQAMHFALVLHHFSDQQIQSLIQQMSKADIKYVLINDLQRSKIASFLFSIFSFVFNFSHMAKVDGKISIQSGFTRKEIISWFRNSDYEIKTIRWKWAFRYIVLAVKK